MPAPSPERIEQARRKAEQAKARLLALEARASQEARKQDTRRKIILGGLLIDAASKDEHFKHVLSTLLLRVERDHDRKAFEGWQAPVLSDAARLQLAPVGDGYHQATNSGSG